MERSVKLRDEKVGKLLLEFSIPAIIGMLVNSLYIVIDRIFIGRVVGAMAISGVSLTFPISILIMAFGMLVGIGAAARISIRLGENNKDEAEHILGNAFVLLIIVSIVITILGLIFVDPMLRGFGASDNTIGYARQFITILISVSTFQTVGFGLNNVIRSEGDPKTAMNTMLIGGICNIILDFLFIYILHFGIKGAAIATSISQGINMIWVLYYFLKGNSMLRIKKKYLRLNKDIVASIFSIGMSPFAMQVAASLVNVILNKSLAIYGGDLAIGAMGIINGISTMILMPIFGINQGSQPVIGFNYGAKLHRRVKKALLLAIAAATFISAAGGIAVQVFPTVLVNMFNKSDMNLTNITVNGIKIFMIMFPIIGFQIVSSNFFQAIGKAKISMFLALLRQVIVLIPMLLILPRIFKLNGVWMAAPVSDAVASILTALFLYFEIKKLNSNEKENLSSPEISAELTK
ncbi:MATE family efflux transporter [Clostridium ljungdahlii]|uniref:Multidrug export protein MepA n=1 Tax=Clostridium ljungdahlii (strain ATCC 55383 / DSM 13528 / PETC) TaxID=748727 RepID=D8GPK4_CLOLD|nr:MATE family efflux transporter [Clostridium ljungdahlii]ADK13913.1 predicted Na+ driven multidrug efflux pump [Clostridium ljungdahlii DSM 13528]OAA87403.1 Multidrug export protein MepA [Clostridium ljungdahlii DSM 13528]